MSSPYTSFVPGVLIRVVDGKKDSRVRRRPGVFGDANGNVIAWLEERTTAVILQPPPDWDRPYPHEQDGYTWVYVFSDLAIDHPDKTRFRAAVGWIVAGPAAADLSTDRFVSPLDPQSFSG